MRRFLHSTAAFSLVEVTLALGIAAFCLIAVFGLMPVGVQTNRNATSQTAATSILSNVIADMRATPKPPAINTSIQYGITFGTDRTLYFDNAGQFTTSLGANSRYRLNITWSGFTGLRYADLKVTWPAAATPANASGSTEMFAAFDRN
jgi:type II secretory pathway pseudopilin PulG